MKNTLLVLLSLIMIVFSSSAFAKEVGVIVERDGRWYEPFTSTLANGQYETYHENGQLKKVEAFKDGVRQGIHEEYYKSGRISLRKTYKGNFTHGLYESYYENGQVHFKGTWINAGWDGLYERFNEDGTLKKKAFYKLGKQYECEGECD